MDNCDSSGRSFTDKYNIDDTDAYHPFRSYCL